MADGTCDNSGNRIMILTSLEEIKKQKYDVCIIGAGPAGITTAINLDRRVKVLLVEAGDIEYSEKSQEYYSCLLYTSRCV